MPKSAFHRVKRRTFLVLAFAACCDFKKTAASLLPVGSDAPSWIPRDRSNVIASFVLDLANNRGWFGGKVYSAEAALLAEVSGSKLGVTRTIGPIMRGNDLVANGSFDSDVSGWTPGYTENPISWAAGQIKITNHSGSTMAVTAWQNVAMDPKRTYRAGYTLVSGTANSRLEFHSKNLSALRKVVIPPNSPVGSWSGLASARLDCASIQIRADSILNGGDVVFDNVSIREAVPLKDWNVGGCRQKLRAKTPAYITKTQVLMVATDDLTLAPASGNTVESGARLEYRVDNHLYLTVTSATKRQAEIDLGFLELNMDFSVELRIGLTTVSARLGAGSYINVSLANGAPGVAKFLIGTSSMGEVWAGSVYSLAIWPLGATSVRFEGDSYVGGAGGVGMPLSYSALADQIITTTGVGGSDMDGITSRMLDADNAELLVATTVFWDGSPNGLTTVGEYCDLIQKCIDVLGHERYVVIPPAIGDNTLKTRIRDEMVGRWPHNVYDWRAHILNLGGVIDRSRFQKDSVHLNAIGMGEAVVGLKAFFDMKSW